MQFEININWELGNRTRGGGLYISGYKWGEKEKEEKRNGVKRTREARG